MSLNLPTLAASALGFTVALAWNDAVSHTMRSVFPRRNGVEGQAEVVAMIAYAVAITVLIIVTVAVIDHMRKTLHRREARRRAAAGAPPCGCPLCAAESPAASFAPTGPAGGGGSHFALVRLWEPPPLTL